MGHRCWARVLRDVPVGCVNSIALQMNTFRSGAAIQRDALGESGERRMKEVSRARLPREASPAKVAKDGQDNNDDDDDPKPGRHAILSLGECRLYDEPTGIRNV